MRGTYFLGFTAAMASPILYVELAKTSHNHMSLKGYSASIDRTFIRPHVTRRSVNQIKRFPAATVGLRDQAGPAGMGQPIAVRKGCRFGRANSIHDVVAIKHDG